MNKIVKFIFIDAIVFILSLGLTELFLLDFIEYIFLEYLAYMVLAIAFISGIILFFSVEVFEDEIKEWFFSD